MRRSTGLGLLFLLLAVAGLYSAYWFVVAGRLESGVRDWAQSLPAQNIDLAWKAVRVGGFPFAFAVDLNDVTLHDRAAPAGDAQAPTLQARARPWDLFHWALTAPSGLRGTIEGARIAVDNATGSVAVGGAGGGTLWLGLRDAGIDIGLHLVAKEADLWLDLPPGQPRTHGEKALGLALDVRQVTMPLVPAPLRNPLDEMSFAATVMGTVPAGTPRQAAAAWRDSGGTIELAHFTLRWGPLAITLSGTIPLDADLQPIGAFSGAIEGSNELVAALVAAGQLRASDANLARLALAVLSKPGPNGRPQISSSFTIQNGQMYLGPARLGAAPRITW